MSRVDAHRRAPIGYSLATGTRRDQLRGAQPSTTLRVKVRGGAGHILAGPTVIAAMVARALEGCLGSSDTATIWQVRWIEASAGAEGA